MLTYRRLDSNIFIHSYNPYILRNRILAAVDRCRRRLSPPWFVAAVVRRHRGSLSASYVVALLAAFVRSGWRGTSVFDACPAVRGRRFGRRVGRAVWM